MSVVPRAAIGAYIRNADRVLLIRRKGPPASGEWALPGGKVHLGESLLAAVEREVLEETGLLVTATEPALHVFDSVHRDSHGQIVFHYVIIDYAATVIGGTLHAGDDAAEADWFSAAELQSITINDHTAHFLRDVVHFDLTS